ncbi:MAG TPA: AI-2E family transporter [Myxococcota bacterium]|nr:AI-2E family transporter [Myxococcota bacterium]
METRVQTVCLVLISTVLTGAALYWLRPMMVPFVLALFITLGLRAGAEFLEVRARVPRSAALSLTVLIGIVFLLLVAAMFSASVSELTDKASLYQDHVRQLAGRAAAFLPAEWRAQQTEALSNVSVGSVGFVIARTANAIANTLSNSFIVLIFVLFLMLGRGRGRGRDGGNTTAGMWGEAEVRIKRYIATKAAISFATGFLVGATLFLLGVPLALVFGLFAFLLNFIPSIGSILSTLLPLPVLLVSPEISLQTVVLALVIPAVLQLTIGNFVEPKIMGESLDLHPVTILLSLILWGMLWGVIGMILSVPIMVVLKILCERFEGSRPLAELLAGRVDAFVSQEAA